MAANRPAKEKAILEALRAGNTRRAASAAGGISADTFYRWLKDSSDFSDGVEKAEGEAEAGFVDIVKRAADDGTWTAAAWWLERRRHEDWKRRDRSEQFSAMTREQLLRFITGESAESPAGEAASVGGGKTEGLAA